MTDFFKSLVENCSELCCLHEVDGTCRYVSPSVLKIAGYGPDEITGKHPTDYLHPEDRKQVRERVFVPLRRGKKFSLVDPQTAVECRVRKKTGEYVYLQTFTSGVYDAHGELINFISLSKIIYPAPIKDFRSISEEIHQKTTELLKAGIWEITPTGQVIQCSNWMYDIFGNKQEAITLSGILEKCNKNSKKIFQQKFQKILEDATPYEVTLELTLEKGNKKWVKAAGAALVQQGRIEKITTVFQEITDYVQAEQNLKKNITQLTHQKKRLEDFNYITSHNLRSPVNNLIVLTQMYKEAESHQERENIIEHIQQLSQIMSSTLDDLVDVVKVLQDVNLNYDLIYLPRLCESILEQLHGEILQKNAEILLHFDFDYHEYVRLYLESYLLNLVSNALKYADPKRTPKIEITFKLINDQKALVVKDNGVGIDLKRFKNKIFKLHQIFHKENKGKGLGLFMTKTQIESLGGRISVQSEPNQGTEFTIIF